VPGKCFIDRIIDNFEDHVVQTRAVISVANVHTRTLSNGIQSLKNFDGTRIVLVAVSHGLGPLI
jgi:hypothetical protein